MDKFSFCESVTATAQQPWHIRMLTDKGIKLGGGADTKALCGVKVQWDLDVPITEHHLNNNVCRKCYEEYIR